MVGAFEGHVHSSRDLDYIPGEEQAGRFKIWSYQHHNSEEFSRHFFGGYTRKDNNWLSLKSDLKSEQAHFSSHREIADRRMQVSLRVFCRFPEEIASTYFAPDIIILNRILHCSVFWKTEWAKEMIASLINPSLSSPRASGGGGKPGILWRFVAEAFQSWAQSWAGQKHMAEGSADKALMKIT